jgi:hypothetical protein
MHGKNAPTMLDLGYTIVLENQVNGSPMPEEAPAYRHSVVSQNVDRAYS